MSGAHQSPAASGAAGQGVDDEDLGRLVRPRAVVAVGGANLGEDRAVVERQRTDLPGHHGARVEGRPVRRAYGPPRTATDSLAGAGPRAAPGERGRPGAGAGRSRGHGYTPAPDGAGAGRCGAGCRCSEALVQVGEDVVDVLEADREPHEVVGHARAQPAPRPTCCWWVVVAGWMISDFASPTFARRLNSFTLLISAAAGVAAAANAEGEHAAEAAGEVPRGVGVGRVRRESRVADPGHPLVLLQPVGHGKRVLGVALDSERERLEALQEEKRVERAQRGAGVAEALHPELDDEGEVADGLDVADAVVAGVRLDEVGEASGGLPVERPAVHDDAADRGAVTADPLRRRVDDDVGAVRDGPAQERGERVVDDEGDPVGVGDVRDRRDVRHVQPRVADRSRGRSPWCSRRSPARRWPGLEPSTKRVVMPSFGSVHWNRL